MVDASRLSTPHYWAEFLKDKGSSAPEGSCEKLHSPQVHLSRPRENRYCCGGMKGEANPKSAATDLLTAGCRHLPQSLPLVLNTREADNTKYLWCTDLYYTLDSSLKLKFRRSLNLRLHSFNSNSKKSTQHPGEATFFPKQNTLKAACHLL